MVIRGNGLQDMFLPKERPASKRNEAWWSILGGRMSEELLFVENVEFWSEVSPKEDVTVYDLLSARYILGGWWV